MAVSGVDLAVTQTRLVLVVIGFGLVIFGGVGCRGVACGHTVRQRATGMHHPPMRSPSKNALAAIVAILA